MISVVTLKKLFQNLHNFHRHKNSYRLSTLDNRKVWLIYLKTKLYRVPNVGWYVNRNWKISIKNGFRPWHVNNKSHGSFPAPPVLALAGGRHCISSELLYLNINHICHMLFISFWQSRSKKPHACQSNRLTGSETSETSFVFMIMTNLLRELWYMDAVSSINWLRVNFALYENYSYKFHKQKLIQLTWTNYQSNQYINALHFASV